MDIIVKISDGQIAAGSGRLVTFSLGSCVGLCLYDPARKIGGMGHFLLPRAPEDGTDTPYKYADSGTRALLASLTRRGASPKTLVARIAGGAQMFRSLGKARAIGLENVQTVLATLRDLHIPLLANDTGKNYARSLFFDLETGKVHLRFFLAVEATGTFLERYVEL